MSRACPSVTPTELPHHVPSTTNNYGSVYDVTYIAADDGKKHVFQRPKSSGYVRNSNPFGQQPAIDFSRANHGAGKGGGSIPWQQLACTAQARTSAGPHANSGNEPTGTTEQQDQFKRPVSAPCKWRSSRYAGAVGGGAEACTHFPDTDWTKERKAAPAPPCRPATATQPHARNAFALHVTKMPLQASTTNSTYGKTAAAASAKHANEQPAFMFGENARDRLYSHSVQKNPVPSLGFRTLPEDEYNPARMSTMAAERCRVGKRLEHEGWVKYGSMAKTSNVYQQLRPETDGTTRCRAPNAPARVAARGGNSNKEMFGEVQCRVIYDESKHTTNETVERLQRTLDQKQCTEDRHAHRLGFSAFSSKFRR